MAQPEQVSFIMLVFIGGASAEAWIMNAGATGHVASATRRAISRPITVRAEGAVAGSASGRKPAPYPAVGGSLGIERVAVHTPGRRLPCIAGSSARQETSLRR